MATGLTIVRFLTVDCVSGIVTFNLWCSSSISYLNFENMDTLSIIWHGALTSHEMTGNPEKSVLLS